MYRSLSLSNLLINLVEAIVAIVEFFLIVRFVLKLFAANAGTPFVAWIYETTRGILYPFSNMFPSPVLEGGVVIEFSTIFAIVIYALLGYFITELIWYVSTSDSRYTSKTQRTTTTIT